MLSGPVAGVDDGNGAYGASAFCPTFFVVTQNDHIGTIATQIFDTILEWLIFEGRGRYPCVFRAEAIHAEIVRGRLERGAGAGRRLVKNGEEKSMRADPPEFFFAVTGLEFFSEHFCFSEELQKKRSVELLALQHVAKHDCPRR